MVRMRAAAGLAPAVALTIVPRRAHGVDPRRPRADGRAIGFGQPSLSTRIRLGTCRRGDARRERRFHVAMLRADGGSDSRGLPRGRL